jgi:hypothetical protein
MHDATFDFNPNVFTTTATEQEKVLLTKIWAKEIYKAEHQTNETRDPSFAVMGTIQHSDTNVILTMLNTINSTCIQPGNGRGMYDQYATCPLRIVRFSANNQATVQDLLTNFWVLYGDDPNNPRAKNHTEYAYDEHSGIVYLRIIQYGKIVPACNRAIRIIKV